MTAEQFAYWLQGFAEVSGKTPTEQEWKIIKDHLALVFIKVTPYYNGTDILGVPNGGEINPILPNTIIC